MSDLKNQSKKVKQIKATKSEIALIKHIRSYGEWHLVDCLNTAEICIVYGNGGNNFQVDKDAAWAMRELKKKFKKIAKESGAKK